MTVINFKRTGGALGREISFEVDLASLPDPVAQRLQALLARSDFFEIDSAGELMARPDEYHYTIGIAAGNTLHTVEVSDTTMPESLQPLVQELTELAKTAG